MSDIIEMTPEVLSPLQELATLQPVVTFTGALQHNDITPEYIAKVKNAIASINTDLNTDEDFVVATANSKACKVAEDHLSNLLNKIISGNQDIAQVTSDVNGIIADLSRTRLTIDKKVKERKISLKKEITDAGKAELKRVVALSGIPGIFKPDFESIDKCTNNMRSYDNMRTKVHENVVNQIAILAWSEVTWTNNKVLIDESLIKFPGIHADWRSLATEPTDKVKLIIAEREATQALLLKKQEEERIAREKKEADDLAAKKLADEAAAKAIEERIADAKTDEETRSPQETPVQKEEVPSYGFPTIDKTPEENGPVAAGFDFVQTEPSGFDDISPDPFSTDNKLFQWPIYHISVTARTSNIKLIMQLIRDIKGIEIVELNTKG